MENNFNIVYHQNGVTNLLNYASIGYVNTLYMYVRTFELCSNCLYMYNVHILPSTCTYTCMSGQTPQIHVCKVNIEIFP